MNEKKITHVIKYRTDADGHHMSITPCPFWRMNHHGITDGAKYVGTMECEGCRWFCSKNVEEETIECAIPAKLSARYEREHRRMENRQAAMAAAIRKPSLQQSKEDGQHSSTQVGSLYVERTNKGRGHYSQRWVAELNITGCRYRLRSHFYEKCWAWIQNIREIYRLVSRRFAYIKSQKSLAILVVEHLAKVGILPTRINGALRSVTSRKRAQEAYNRAMAIYKVSHKKKEKEA